MRNLGRVSVILGSLVCASAALAVSISGCGGDNSIGPPDATQDTTSDRTTSDHTSDHKVTDAPQKDSAPDADGSVQDAPSDVQFFDVADAKFDVPDALPDGPFDVAITAFPAALNLAYCSRLQACCATISDAGADAGAFVANCISALGPFSAISNLNLANTSSPNVTYSVKNAEKCLEQVSAIPCGPLSAAQLELNVLTCAGAIQGKLANGSGPCTSSFDCKTGYCPADGGNCTALGKLASACKDTTYSTDCTYLGNGEPLLYCNADSGTCQNDQANGSPCTEYEECTSQICFYGGSGGVCAMNYTDFSDPSFCASF